jgi:serine/threonine protein kinase/formylglycine-generating enzyme required for sulfatase activity
MSTIEPDLIFTAWAVRMERGENPDFDAVLREHPAHADSLRRLHRDWTLFAPLLSRVVPGLLAGEIPESSAGGDARASDALDDSSEPFVEALGLRIPLASRYRFRAVVGRGGAGVVLKVWDAKLGRELAMKVVLGRDEGSPSPGRRALGRFVSEARIAGRLDHPGIVPVHELGADEDGRAFFTMKLVQGSTLADVLREGGAEWSTTRVVGVLIKVCDAMAYAHDRRVLHRDLKPSNVMIGSFGEVYVMDWGLARIVGRADTRDLRIRPAAEPNDSPPRTDDPLEALVTMDGAVLGTPAYMSPEQARGDIESLGPATDVYAIGAMLYERLAGHPPYLPWSASRVPRDVLARVVAGAPDPFEAPLPRNSTELVSVCMRAMARDTAARYASVTALREDLQAYLDGRRVAAHPTGAWASLRKWTRRNPTLAALSFVVGVCAFVGLALVLRNRMVTHELALVTAVTDMQRLRDQAASLWPLAPSELPRMRSWMQRADEMRGVVNVSSADRPDLERRLDEVRVRARAWSAEERARDRKSHPRHRELEHILSQEAVLRANLASRSIGAPLLAPPPDAIDLDRADTATAASCLARAKLWISPERSVFGRELAGWSLVLRALDLAQPDERWRADYYAAQAEFVNGHDDAARTHLRIALEGAPAVQRDDMRGAVAFLEKIIDEHGAPEAAPETCRVLAEIVSQRAALEALVDVRRTFTFDSAADGWLHDMLETALQGPEFLYGDAAGVLAGAHPDGDWSVKRRIDFLEDAERALREDTHVVESWRNAVGSLREHVAPGHPGIAIVPRGDLLPLGRDPQSGLYEFGHLPSGSPPKRAPDGTWLVHADTCIVFVLVPGGNVRLGAQREDPAAERYDAHAESDEVPTASVALSPYLLSKYEVTQGQWLRLSGTAPSFHVAAFADRFHAPDDRHPLEQVSANEARALLARFGMDLPTEAQWEHAARGNANGVWYVGDDPHSLAGHANLADQYLRGHGGPRDSLYDDWLDDGYAITAPVGSFEPNAFGLYDVCGNVAELTKGDFDSFGREFGEEEGEWRGAGGGSVAIRGGSMLDVAANARSARRTRMHPDARDPAVGLRPRLIDPSWRTP